MKDGNIDAYIAHFTQLAHQGGHNVNEPTILTMFSQGLLCSLPTLAWISMTQTASMNGQWQPRGITRFTSKNKPLKAHTGKANLPLQRIPNKGIDLGKDSNGQIKGGDQDTRRPNQHRLTPML